jgi:hypothetical protein
MKSARPSHSETKMLMMPAMVAAVEIHVSQAEE